MGNQGDGELTALSAAKQRLECWPLLRREDARRCRPNKRPGVRNGALPSSARRPGRTPSPPSLHLGAHVPHREAQERPGCKPQTHCTVPQRPEVHAHGFPLAITPEPPSAPPLVQDSQSAPWVLLFLPPSPCGCGFRGPPNPSRGPLRDWGARERPPPLPGGYRSPP